MGDATHPHPSPWCWLGGSAPARPYSGPHGPGRLECPASKHHGSEQAAAHAKGHVEKGHERGCLGPQARL